jgi:hypothetical protein
LIDGSSVWTIQKVDAQRDERKSIRTPRFSRNGSHYLLSRP